MGRLARHQIEALATQLAEQHRRLVDVLEDMPVDDMLQPAPDGRPLSVVVAAQARNRARSAAGIQFIDSALRSYDKHLADVFKKMTDALDTVLQRLGEPGVAPDPAAGPLAQLSDLLRARARLDTALAAAEAAAADRLLADAGPLGIRLREARQAVAAARDEAYALSLTQPAKDQCLEHERAIAAAGGAAPVPSVLLALQRPADRA